MLISKTKRVFPHAKFNLFTFLVSLICSMIVIGCSSLTARYTDDGTGGTFEIEGTLEDAKGLGPVKTVPKTEVPPLPLEQSKKEGEESGSNPSIEVPCEDSNISQGDTICIMPDRGKGI